MIGSLSRHSLKTSPENEPSLEPRGDVLKEITEDHFVELSLSPPVPNAEYCSLVVIGSRYLVAMMDKELETLKTSADMMYAALQVFLRSEKLRALLEANDPKALEQAVRSCAFYSSKCLPQKVTH